MKTNHNILWIIAFLYTFIIWLYLLIAYVVFKSDSFLPLIGVAVITVIAIYPAIYWLRHSIFYVKKLYEQHKFKEVIEFMKKKPNVVFKQDLENLYLYLAVSHWSLKESDQFNNYLKLITSPRLLAIRDMWIIIDHLVNHKVYDAEEYYKTLLVNAKTVKPIIYRRALPERTKKMIELAKNKSNKTSYLEIFRQASNPRVIAYLNEFEDDYMV